MGCSPYLRVSPSRSWKFVFFLLPFGVWTIYLLTFYPALMSPDSIRQWKQARTMELNDVHPAFHTLTIWAITRLWPSPAAVALFQIVALALVSGWGFVILKQAGASRVVLLMALAFLCLHPVNGYLAVTLWKDVLYSLFILLLTIFIIKMLRDASWIENGRAWFSLGLILAALALYRHNGILVAGLAWLWLLLVFRSRRLYLGKAVVAALGVLLVVKFALFPLLRVAPNRRAYQTLIHQMGAFIENGVAFSDEERQFLDSLRPLRDKWNYNCYTVNTTLYRDGKFDFAKLHSNRGKFLRLWWKTVKKHPRIFLQHQKYATAFLWNIVPPARRHLQTVVYRIADNDLGLQTKSVFPALLHWGSHYARISHRGNLFWLVWRPPVYLYLAIIALGAACIRAGSFRFLTLGAPVILNTFSLLISAASPELRYQYPLILTMPFLVAACFIRWGSSVSLSNRSNSSC